MTSQQSNSIVANEAIEETQNDAKHETLPHSDAEQGKTDKTEPGTLVNLTESDQNKSFAHDINFKIDQLESHIDSLGNQYQTSEGKLRMAIGDIRSRTAIVTDEIAKFSENMLKADIEHKGLVSDLDARLKSAVEKLKGQLGGLDSQVATHHASLQSIQKDLDDAYTHLDTRITALQADMDARFEAVTNEQQTQNKTQQAFAEYLEDLQSKSSKTADDLYNTQVDNAEQHRLGKKNFVIGTSALAATAMITLGVITYLHWGSPEPLTTADVNQTLDSRIGTLEADLAGSYASKTDLSQTSQKVDTLKTDLEGQLALTSQSATDSLEALSEKISALQLSVYGPEDTAAAALTTSIEIKDKDWLAQQNPENYSIQLVGLYREQSMVNFINRHADDLGSYPVAFNVSEYRGQDWYNVVYGSFSSFSEAQAVLNSFPAGIQRNAPWIRQIDSIQRTAIN